MFFILLVFNPARKCYNIKIIPLKLKLLQETCVINDLETCGRFGEWGYLWMDQSILSGKQAAEEISRL
jgi:hypothetical protein